MAFLSSIVCDLFKSLDADTFVGREQDAGVKQDCVNTVKSAIEQLGGLDIIISNAVGYTTEDKSFVD
jgi:NAD(P)-dependent dehydrogenase (short-subunit alcohol dehydrogenase family)